MTTIEVKETPMQITFDTATAADKIIVHLRESWACFSEAASIYAQACDKSPDFATALIERHPFISRKIIAALEAARTGSADWRIAAEIVEHGRYISKLPAKLQTHVIDNGVDVAVNGETVHLPIYALLPHQAKAVFVDGRVSTPTEQANYARSAMPSVARVSRSPKSWSVIGTSITISTPCVLTYSDLLDMIKAIKK